MSTIKLNELAESDINLSDLIAKSDGNGLMTRTNIEKLANYIGAISTSGIKGAIESTSPAPLEDGLYPCTESGTYTNFGGEVVDISGQVVFISVSDSQLVFTLVEIPLNIVLDSVPTENSTNAIESGGVFDEFKNVKNQQQSMIAPTYRNGGYSYINDNHILTLTENVEFAFNDVRITITAGTLDLSGKFRGTYYLTYIDGTTTYSLSDLTWSSSLPKTNLTENDIIIGYTNENKLYSRFINNGLENLINARESIFYKIDGQLIPPPSFRNGGCAYVSDSDILTLTEDCEIPFRDSYITLSSGTLDLNGKYRGLFYLDYVNGTTTYSLSDLTWSSSLKIESLSENRLIIGYTNEDKLYSPLIFSAIQNYIDFKNSSLQTSINQKANATDVILKTQTPYGTGTKIVLFGDSITEQNGSYTVSSGIYDQARGYWNMANFFLNQRFNKIYNAGIGGNTTIQMLARIQTDVIDKNPDVVFFMGGINDINVLNETDASVIFGRIEQIYDELTENGIKIITSLITPSVSSIATKKDTLSQLNKLISNYAYSNPNIILVDMGKTIVDYATGDPITGWTDNTHPYDVAAFEMGWEVAEQIRPFFKETPFLPYFKNDDRLLNSNAFLDGDVNGLATGFQATGITGTTYSKEVRDDRLGEWQIIESPNTSSNNSVYNFVSNPENITFTQGDKIYGACEIDVDATDIRVLYFEIYCQDVNYSTTFYSANLLTLPQYTGVTIKDKKYKGTFKTEAFEIPADSTRVRVRVFYDFTGTIKIGRVCVLKQ